MAECWLCGITRRKMFSISEFLKTKLPDSEASFSHIDPPVIRRTQTFAKVMSIGMRRECWERPLWKLRGVRAKGQRG